MRPRAARRAAWVLAALVPLACPAAARAQTADDHAEQMAGPSPEMFVRLFGSVDWGATQEPDRPNAFALGQFAIFVTSSINEHVSVLAEAVIEGSGTNTRVVTDLERLQLTYRANDFFQVSAGRYHTGIGFYNAAFHHGSYFETPIGRPRIFRFEDQGGVLPVHEVGLSARGAVPRLPALHYLAEVGNGRMWSTATEPDTVEGEDQNGAKSTNVGLSLQPANWHGVELGASFYRDDVPNAPALPLRQHIGSLYAVYRTPGTELMAEWLHLEHRAVGAALHFDNNAGYLQASRAWGMLRPYYRYDRLDIDPATPLIGYAGSAKAHIVGLRIDPAEWVGLKAQYERADENGRRGIDAVRAQLVFVF